MAFIILPPQAQFSHTANSCCRFCSADHCKLSTPAKKTLPESKFRLSVVQGFACKTLATVNDKDINIMIHSKDTLNAFIYLKCRGEPTFHSRNNHSATVEN